MAFHVPVSQLYVFPGKIPVQVLYLFSNSIIWVFDFAFVVELYDLYIFWILTPYQIHDLQTFSPNKTFKDDSGEDSKEKERESWRDSIHLLT